MPWKECSTMDQKRFFITEWQTGVFTVTELAVRFGISTKTAHKYINKFKKDSWKGLQEGSRRPHSSPNKTPAHIEDILVKIGEKYPLFGPRKVRNRAIELHPDIDFPAITTVADILVRNGRPTQKRAPARRRIESINRYAEALFPNHIWTTDYKGDFLLTNSKRCYPITLCDMCSRYILGIQAHKSTNLKDAKRFFIWAFQEYGMPLFMLSDNGSPFAAAMAPARLSRLSVWWIKLGIQPIFIDPASPQQNAAHERMHRELKKWTALPPGKNFKQQQDKFDEFRVIYNDIRSHEYLNDDTPWQHYYTSDRKYTGDFVDFTYPDNVIPKRVSRNGAIRWPGDRWLGISTSLIEETIGLEPIDLNTWCVWFHNTRLGYFNEDKLRLVDYLGRSVRNKHFKA